MFSRNFFRNFSLILQQFIAQLSVFLTQQFLTPDNETRNDQFPQVAEIILIFAENFL